jgi:hypothetical protein
MQTSAVLSIFNTYVPKSDAILLLTHDDLAPCNALQQYIRAQAQSLFNYAVPIILQTGHVH